MQCLGNKQVTWDIVYIEANSGNPNLSLAFMQTVSFTNVFLVCKSLYADFYVQNTA